MSSPFLVHYTRPGSLLPLPHRVQADSIESAIADARHAHPDCTVVGATQDTWETCGPLARRDDYGHCWQFRESNDVFWIRHDNVTVRVMVSPHGLAATFTPLGMEDARDQPRPHAGLSFEDAAEQALVAHRSGLVSLPDKARAEHQRVLRSGQIDLNSLTFE